MRDRTVLPIPEHQSFLLLPPSIIYRSSILWTYKGTARLSWPGKICRKGRVDDFVAISQRSTEASRSLTHGCTMRQNMFTYELSQPSPIPNYTVWWYRHTCLNSVPCWVNVTWIETTVSRTRDLTIVTWTSDHNKCWKAICLPRCNKSQFELSHHHHHRRVLVAGRYSSLSRSSV